MLPEDQRGKRLSALLDVGEFEQQDAYGSITSPRMPGGDLFEYITAPSKEHYGIHGSSAGSNHAHPEAPFLKEHFQIEKDITLSLNLGNLGQRIQDLQDQLLQSMKNDGIQFLARAVAVEPIIRELGQAEKYYEARKNTASSSASDSEILTAREGWCQNAKAQFENYVSTGGDIKIKEPNKDRVNESGSFWGLVKKVTSAIASFCGKKMGIDAHYHSAMTFATMSASTPAAAPAPAPAPSAPSAP